MLVWKTHSDRHLLAQFNAVERFSIPEFGNVKWKAVSESKPVASALPKHPIQRSVFDREPNAAGSHHSGKQGLCF